MITALCLTTFIAVQPPAADAPPPATAAIRGRVLAGDTGQPLRKAQLRANQIDVPAGATSVAGRENRVATTDADGRYEFKDLPPGRYGVSASKGAYVGMSWGQEQPNQAGKPIDLAPGQTIERVDFTLPRGGVITGRVLDEYGEPLAELPVEAVRGTMLNGRRDLAPIGSAMTDDEGVFRIFGLTPGQYYVRARWRRMGTGEPGVDRTGYPLTFFPGTPRVEEAQRFTVAAGQTVSDLAMAVGSIRTARVEGSIVDSQGRSVSNTMLTVSQSTGNGFSSVGTLLRPDGTFVFGTLSPGEYTFRTQPIGPNKEVAMMKVTVGNEDIKDLRLVAAPPSLITGRIVVDPGQAPSVAAMGLSLFATDSDLQRFGGLSPVKIADDLTFEIAAMPGKNKINTLNLPPAWTVRAIRVNTIDVIDDGIEIRPGENITGVDVELTSRLTIITGAVTSTRGEPVKDYTVIVFAADNKRWMAASRYLRTARPDQDGRFKISALPPADYHIVAVEKLEPNVPPTDPDFLERMLPGAKSLSLGEGETKTVELRVASVP